MRALWTSSGLDWRSFLGGDSHSAHYTDHALVRASIRLRLKAKRQYKRPLRLDATKIRTDVGNGFRLQLHNHFALLAQVTSGSWLASEWEAMKSATSEAAPLHLGESRCLRQPFSYLLYPNAKRSRVRKHGT